METGSTYTKAHMYKPTSLPDEQQQYVCGGVVVWCSVSALASRQLGCVKV